MAKHLDSKMNYLRTPSPAPTALPCRVSPASLSLQCAFGAAPWAHKAAYFIFPFAQLPSFLSPAAEASPPPLPPPPPPPFFSRMLPASWLFLQQAVR
jgi:hypothetical protein